MKLTHPDRLYWPDAGVTKEGLADYYADIWPHIAPFIVGRALARAALSGRHRRARCFSRNMSGRARAPRSLRSRDPREAGRNPDRRQGSRRAAGARAGRRARNPSLGLDRRGLGAARHSGDGSRSRRRRRLGRRSSPPRAKFAKDCGSPGLGAFVKTSGGKGLHVAAPLAAASRMARGQGLRQVDGRCHGRRQPGDLRLDRHQGAARPGKIFIDYLRNQRGATAIAPYSPRARPGAPVSMPLDWDELSAGDRAEPISPSPMRGGG